MVLLVALLISATAGLQPQTEDGAARLRALFFQRDYETAVLDGVKHVAAAPASTDVRAWHVLNLARAERADDAVKIAREMVGKTPQDGWSWFALAGALHYKGGSSGEAADAGAKALTLLPGNADAMWLRATTLAGESRAEAIVFVDANLARVKSPAELLGVKAYAQYRTATAASPRDEATLKAAFETYAEVRRLDPAHVNAHYLPGTYLLNLKRVDEAYDLLEKAAALAPGSRDVHQSYWSAIRAHPTLTAEQKNAEIEADLTSFLEKHGNRPGALLTASYAARDLKQPDRQKKIENTIVETFNDSLEAEWVLIGRLREFRTEETVKKPEYRDMLRAYVARPKHYHTGLLGETYRNLFFALLEDPAVSSDELLRVTDGMTKYEVTNIHISYVGAAIALADRKIHLQKAEQIARDAFAAMRTRVARDRSFYTSEKEFQDRLRTAPAIVHDALGWVLLAQGRAEEAEKELLKAHELAPDNRDNLYHLGRFYEAKNETATAEDYYVKGLAVQLPGTNPSAAPLQALYVKRHGSADGYDKYLAGIRDRDRVARRDKIMASRVASPAPVTPFALKTLDGVAVTLESLKGKVVVINFWGIWCGWCVREMPDLQKLHEKYKADPGVAILTIDNDQNPSDVPPWMKKNGYDFAVLLDNGYVDAVNVHAFPTTWFLDREGRKVFEKVGWSEKLLEEFSWRVEAIRGGS